MAIHRGIQSALFYYLSCAPCTEARHRRKRRKEADLARLEKEALNTDALVADYHYKHPLTTNTNPAWDLEIAIGPSKESKAAAKIKAKKEKETEPIPRSSDSTAKSDKGKQPSSISDPDSEHNAKVQWASTFQRSYIETPIMVPQRTLTNASSRRQPPNDPTPTPAQAASPQWLSPVHPPLNEFHPPTVTRYDSPADISWMLEPPPPARVMRGNEQERPKRSPYTIKSPTISDSQSPRLNQKTSNDDPASAQGLGLTYLADAHSGSEADDEEVMSDGIVKRDSAGPAPARDDDSSFLFPPKEWPAQRRKDSGSGHGGNDADDEDDYDDTPNKHHREEHHRHRRAGELRWRWSNDW
ncbi:hypothetical protein ANO11243_040800 [Dothideomycetidae sp. 11243]|nr:hypothetical protein ANO11243_040800 [fungal sp. No.11243]